MIVAVGLDNTLCASDWRKVLIESQGWDWYHAAMIRDAPIHVMVKFVSEMVANGHSVIAVTSRPEKWREATNAWLLKHGVLVDDVLMRPDDDWRPAPQVKVDLVKNYLGGSLKALDFVVDDHEGVIAAFRSRGVYCLQFSR